MANKLNTIEKLNKIEELLEDNFTEEQKEKAYQLFWEIVENDEVNNEDEAYEFGRVFQEHTFELNASWGDYGDAYDYLRRIVEKLNSDYIATTYKEELGIELD